MLKNSTLTFTAKSLILETSQFRLSTPTITKLILGGSLRELVLSSHAQAPMVTLSETHTSQGSPQLSNLEILEIGWLSSEYLNFFKSTPNLIELRVKGLGRMELGPEPLDPKILPKLERFTCHNQYLGVFVRNRPIKSIVTRDSTGISHAFHLGQDDNSPFGGYGPNFGSTTVLESLTWNNCTRNREVLQYVVEHNRKIMHLEVTPALAYGRVRILTIFQTYSSNLY
jgi:hypothetical protein